MTNNTPLPFGADEGITIGRYGPTGTALVRIDPAGDPRVHALAVEIIGVAQRAEARIVASDADAKMATNDLLFIKGLSDTIEAKRKEYVAPLNGYVKDINAAFKEYSEPLERANRVTREKVLAFKAEQERIRQEQERINQLRIEAARAEMELKGELSESVNLVEVAPEPPAHIRTGFGMAGTTKVWHWEIVDFAALPDMYKIPDAAKIKKLVQAGGTIPGVRAWQEETLRVTGAR